MRHGLLLGLVVVAAGCGGGAQEADLPLGKQLAATATVAPAVHLFAEPVQARIEVVVDRRHLDPARVRVEPRFLPYDVKERARSREDRGRFTVLRFDYLLRCLRIACIPEILPSAAGAAETGRGERRSLVLPAARVLYDDPAGTTRTLTRAPWPELVSVSRIKESDVPQYGFVFKTSVTPLPEGDFRVSPTLLGAGLLAGSLALLALPGGLLLGWLRRRRPEPAVEEAPELTPLERALALVEWARDRRNGSERREALEVLAVELEACALDDLARRARTLAWARSAPAPEDAERLVSEVREANGR
ncbi:MAG TPA: hypothetical protein VNJ53_04795 [Gaiellaceae bacterium]|nr:hypothetical protein [Gaiellaceae bacterium]